MTGGDARADGARRHPWSEPDPEEASNPGLAAQWFAFLGGMGGYVVHLMAGVPLVPLACDIGSTWPIHLLTAVVAVIIVASFAVSWWLRARSAGESTEEEATAAARDRQVGGADAPAELDVDPRGSVRVGPRRRARYLANLGLLLNPIALVIVVATEINIHVYDPCLPGLS